MGPGFWGLVLKVLGVWDPGLLACGEGCRTEGDSARTRLPSRLGVCAVSGRGTEE